MRRNKLRVFIHFVWRTWDSQPLIRQDAERRLYRHISSVCCNDGCQVLAAGGTEDHVHLLVALPSTICMADLMKHVKGGSSRLFSEELRPGEWFQWQGHYGAFSVSPRDRESVIDYIGRQKQHHADGSLWHEWEEPTEEFTFPDA